MNMKQTIPAFADILERLNQYTNYERTGDYPPGHGGMGTARVERLLRLAGDPHLDIPVIHIAGTKGKGSTAYLTARLLAAHGLRTALYTSPHVSHLLERFVLDGNPVQENAFCDAFSALLPALDAMRSDPPTYFELLTATAFRLFSNAKPDVAIIEVGLGGRLDATNVSNLPVVVSGITPISLDHMAQLGNSLRAIAGEKAGILREETPVVLANQEPGVMTFLRQRCDALGCPTRIVGMDVDALPRESAPPTSPKTPQRLDVRGWSAKHEDIPLGMMGSHQTANAAMAYALAEVFLEKIDSKPLRTGDLRAAWRSASLPGRIECIGENPWVILDGAHNPAATWVLSETLRQRVPGTPRILVFAAPADKEIATMLRILVPGFDRVILTTYPHPRCMDMREVSREVLAGHGDVKLELLGDPAVALRAARNHAGEHGLVCVTGSLYLAGAVRNYEKA